MGWAEFIAAFAVFFISHSVPVRPPVRPFLVARLGARGFALAYSALSLAVLVWLIGAAGRAPYVPLWDRAAWHAPLALAGMALVVAILSLSLGRPNPFSFGGARNDRFDPDRPGLVRLVRHPLLVALALWALVHLVANGDLAHALLFATFAAFAVLGQRLVDRRKRREMGRTRWEALRAKMARGRARVVDWRDQTLWMRLAAGVAFYVLLLRLHPHVLGVSPLP